MALPTDAIAVKINANQPIFVFCCGDSTMQGVSDQGQDLAPNGTAYPGPNSFSPAGFPGRFAASVGSRFDLNTTSTTGSSLNHYNVSTRGGLASTLTVQNAGVGGTQIGGALSAVNGLSSRPDMIIVRDGINDAQAGTLPGGPTAATFSAAYQTVFDAAFSKWPDTVVVMTSNYLNGNINAFQDRAFFDQVGNHMPLTPALQQSLHDPRVWALDLRQAITNMTPPSSGFDGGLHPTGPGYMAEANFATAQMFTDPFSTLKPTILTTDLGTITVGTPYSLTLSPHGPLPVTWDILPAGGGVVSVVPPGLGLDHNSGILSGTPTHEISYDFTVTGTNSNGTGPGKRYTGIVYPPAPSSFTGNTVVRTKVKLNGQWYPVTRKVKVGGVWKSVVTRA